MRDHSRKEERLKRRGFTTIVTEGPQAGPVGNTDQAERKNKKECIPARPAEFPRSPSGRFYIQKLYTFTFAYHQPLWF